MNALQQWMEKHLVPVAAKIGSQKHLVALRDSFVGMLPAIIGLIFAFSWGYNLSKAYKVNELAGGIVGVAALVSGLPNIIAIATNGLSEKAMETVNNNIAAQGIATWKMGLSVGQLDAGAYFTVIIMGALAVILYAKLMLADITIKMPDSVPPAVSKAFLAIIPTIVAVYVVSIIYYFIKVWTGNDLIYLIGKYIAEPFQALSQSIVSVLIVTFFVSLFWFFGIHGTNVLGAVLDGIWGPLQLANMDVYNKVIVSVLIVTFFVSLFWFFGIHGTNVLGAVLDGIWGPLQLANMDVYNKVKLEGVKDLVAKGATDKAHAIDGNFVTLWVRGSWDAYAWFGGTAGTITLIIAILWFSKREDYKTVAKLSVAPGIFNINEPVMFGMPLVLNSLFFIPLLLAPMVSVTIAYIATAMHLVAPVVLQVPWVTPPFINAFMATGFDWRAIVVTAVTFAASFAIWFPFVIASNSMEEEA